MSEQKGNNASSQNAGNVENGAMHTVKIQPVSLSFQTNLRLILLYSLPNLLICLHCLTIAFSCENV